MSCLFDRNHELIFLGEGKKQVSCLLEILGSLTGIPKGCEKFGNFIQEEGLTILEVGGRKNFEIFKGKGGLKRF